MIAELEERSQKPARWMLQVSSSFSWEAWVRVEDKLTWDSRRKN
jgi:hypothetical protein